MKYIIPLFLFFWFSAHSVFAQQVPYRTMPVSSDIYTVQVKANCSWGKYPIIELGSDEYVCLNFDRLSENSSARLRYKLVHCNADWKPSSLSDIEYVDGFNDNLILDYEPSMGSTVGYTNFQVEIPNNDIRLKVSGNYAVIVTEEDNPDDVLLTACFSVIETQVKLSGTMSSITDIDANKGHQQISFVVDYGSNTLRDPLSEIKTFVRQNNRFDTQKQVKPTYLQPGKLRYEQNRDLIFEAGNEYRRFESTSYRYNGLNVESVDFQDPFYFTNIVPDKIRARKAYSYDQDQNGRFLIHSRDLNENSFDYACDYFITNFYLPMEQPILENIYVNGDFTYDTFSDKYLMKYDNLTRQYQLSLLLKQGAYNYMYLTKEGNRFSPAKMEGNYFETENEYTVSVYYKPPGQQYDKLIGFLLIKK
ncbi:hypothetical protein M2132_000748 [Dysgonomonas sp. PH5-45]|uniref:type IX secretion system plug protein n=1 Tax=unclassified Dysgonomonas TaxID=2630389 RepID=UPI0024740515|nr:MULTISPECIES: DUF5103 domain-containing protein [unclassified Dysgonomonas]MDH6354420.1 hypothetical protein [Dysgonomonas sp. PH5-45]MDH6387319.1 hypothetical protein [Dysgonomonas sp. PH5-37]